MDFKLVKEKAQSRITSYNVCYTKLLRIYGRLVETSKPINELIQEHMNC